MGIEKLTEDLRKVLSEEKEERTVEVSKDAIEAIYAGATDLLAYIEHSNLPGMLSKEFYGELHDLALANFEGIANIAGDED